LEQRFNIVQFIRFLQKISEKIINFGVISTFVRNVQKIVWELPEIAGDGGSNTIQIFIYLLNLEIRSFSKFHQVKQELIERHQQYVSTKFNIKLKIPSRIRVLEKSQYRQNKYLSITQ
jgi:hypothetical protein